MLIIQHVLAGLVPTVQHSTLYQVPRITAHYTRKRTHGLRLHTQPQPVASPAEHSQGCTVHPHPPHCFLDATSAASKKRYQQSPTVISEQETLRAVLLLLFIMTYRIEGHTYGDLVMFVQD